MNLKKIGNKIDLKPVTTNFYLSVQIGLPEGSVLKILINRSSLSVSLQVRLFPSCNHQSAKPTREADPTSVGVLRRLLRAFKSTMDFKLKLDEIGFLNFNLYFN